MVRDSVIGMIVQTFARSFRRARNIRATRENPPPALELPVIVGCRSRHEIYKSEVLAGGLAQLVERLNGISSGAVLTYISLAHFEQIYLWSAGLMQLSHN